MPYVNGVPCAQSATSRSAAASIVGSVSAMRAQIVEAVNTFEQGLTCDEIEVLFDMKHQTASARCRDLVKAEKIIDSGERRLTRSGRAAIVYKGV